MNNLLRHLMLKAQVSSGLGADVAIWGISAVVAVSATMAFLLISAFVSLANRYDSVIAGFVLAGAFALIALVAIVACLLARNRNRERAQVALVERSSHVNWLDPKLATVAFQIGQTIGWRRLASLSAVAFVAAGLAREWFGHSEPRP